MFDNDAATDRRTHWLTPLATDRRPYLDVFLDCEAFIEPEPDGGADCHTFACAAVAVAGNDPLVHFTRDALWETVDGLCERDRTIRIWAYQSEYDVRLAAALRGLGRLGWEIRRFALDDRSCWVTMAKDRYRLTIADARSFIPSGMDMIYRDLGIDRPALATIADGDPQTIAPLLARRAAADVAAMRSAILDHLYPFLDYAQAGSLQVTGPGQSMAQYRRRFLRPKSILVHEWPDVLGAERAASWAGRAEAWRHGTLAGPWTEYDYTLAYPRLCLSQPLPVKYIGPGPLQARPGAVYAILSRCDVQTRVPVLPAHGPTGEIVWGIGSFSGWYWDAEVRMARMNGARVTIRDEHVYECAPVLDEWARWISGEIENHPSPIIRRVCKQWARALIGRFALRFPEWEEYADGWEGDDLIYCPGWGMDVGPTAYLVMGGRMWQRRSEKESPNSVPAITSYITSLGRVRIWETMVQAGLENLAYVDTDSVIVNAEGARRLELHLPPGLRVKGEYARIRVMGTRALIVDGNPRIAGLPRGAEEISDDYWEAESFDGPASGRLGALETVRTRRKGFTLRHTDGRRERLPGASTRNLGMTRPVVLHGRGSDE